MKTFFEQLSETIDPINKIIRDAYQAGLEKGRKEKRVVQGTHNIPDHDWTIDRKGFCLVCQNDEQDADEELNLRL